MRMCGVYGAYYRDILKIWQEHGISFEVIGCETSWVRANVREDDFVLSRLISYPEHWTQLDNDLVLEKVDATGYLSVAPGDYKVVTLVNHSMTRNKWEPLIKLRMRQTNESPQLWAFKHGGIICIVSDSIETFDDAADFVTKHAPNTAWVEVKNISAILMHTAIRV